MYRLVTSFFLFFFSESVQSMLQKHIPRVSRALSKVLASIDDLYSVAEYLEALGRTHHQIGVNVR